MMENTFLKACQNDDKTLMNLFIDKGGLDFDFQDDLGNTGLHYLCMNDDLVMSDKLINAGAKVNLSNFHMETPLHLAAACGSTPLIKLLLSKGADINSQDRYGITPLITAIRNKQIPAAEFIILLDADKYARTKNNLSAADYVKAESLEELFHYFEDEMPIVDSNGNTPLHHAIYQNDIELIRKIIATNKSCLDIQNKQGLTPLLTAISKLNYAISDIILQAGADPNIIETKDENSPLHVAALNGITWLGEILLEHGAKVNAVNKEGSTPLMLAVQGHHREFISLLLHKNASIGMIDNHGKSAWDYALNWGSDELVEILDIKKSRFFPKGRAK